MGVSMDEHGEVSVYRVPLCALGSAGSGYAEAGVTE